MINFGTKEYYQGQIDKAILQKKLLEQAINLKQKNGEIEVAEFETYSEILADAVRRVEWVEDDLKIFLERVENKQ